MEEPSISPLFQCKNCDNQFEGIICNNCGQKVKHYSSSPKGLFLEWWHARKEDAIHFLFTTRELILRPDLVLNEYISGKRKKYYNSTNYFLLVASVVTFITLQFRTVDPDAALSAFKGFYESMGVPISEQNKGGELAYEWITQHYNVALLLTLPFLALASYWTFRYFFRKKTFKLGDHFIMNLFIYGLSNFLLIPTLPFFDPGNPESKAMFISVTFMLVLYTWVFKRWYKVNWLKALVAAILFYVLYFIIFVLFIIGAVIAILLVVFIVLMIMKLF